MLHLFTNNSSISTLYVTNELLSQIMYLRVQKLECKLEAIVQSEGFAGTGLWFCFILHV